jgi:hypothetical protein
LLGALERAVGQRVTALIERGEELHRRLAQRLRHLHDVGEGALGGDGVAAQQMCRAVLRTPAGPCGIVLRLGQLQQLARDGEAVVEMVGTEAGPQRASNASRSAALSPAVRARSSASRLIASRLASESE